MISMLAFAVPAILATEQILVPSLVGLVVLLIVVGFIVGIFGGKMDPEIKKMMIWVLWVIVAIVAIIALLWLLQVTGVWNGSFYSHGTGGSLRVN